MGHRIRVYWTEDMVSTYETQQDHDDHVASYKDREYPIRDNLFASEDQLFEMLAAMDAGMPEDDLDFYRYTPEQAAEEKQHDARMVERLTEEWENDSIELSDEEWAELQELQAGARAYHAKLQELSRRSATERP